MPFIHLFIFHIYFLRSLVRDAKAGLACAPNLLNGVDPMDTASIHAKYMDKFGAMKITEYREHCKANVSEAEKTVQDAQKVVNELRAEARIKGNSSVAQMAMSLRPILTTYEEELVYHFLVIIHFLFYTFNSRRSLRGLRSLAPVPSKRSRPPRRWRSFRQAS